LKVINFQAIKDILSKQMDRIPRDFVGPGRTALTVMPVPAKCSANPREIAIWAVFVIYPSGRVNL
jgi:hypothetical protein